MHNTALLRSSLIAELRRSSHSICVSAPCTLAAPGIAATCRSRRGTTAIAHAKCCPCLPSRMLVRTSHAHFAVSSVHRSFCVSSSCTLVLLAGGPPWAAVLMCGVQERECVGGCVSPLGFFLFGNLAAAMQRCVSVLWGVWRCTAISAWARRLWCSAVLALRVTVYCLCMTGLQPAPRSCSTPEQVRWWHGALTSATRRAGYDWLAGVPLDLRHCRSGPPPQWFL